jgi:small GTP-binding protein
MPLRRQLVLVIGLIIVLAMALWLVNGLGNLYWSISYTSPFLAGLLVLLLIVLIGLLIFAFLYYANLFQFRPRTKAKLQVPQAKAEAADATLKVVEKQVTQIQDVVARKALMQRSREIAADLERGEVRVVVFGTGSSGKTALINALFGRVVGQVGAPMGTTETGAMYQLRLRGLAQEILILDTPGILEMGEAGNRREQAARQLAVEADLLLFVVDDDLRRSQLLPLQALAEIGKRSILVFNKIDLYTETDRSTILACLRDHVRGLIPGADVVAIAANPAPITLDTGDFYCPEPQIMPLIRRMAEILRDEGEDLIADNILLQSQRLGNETREILDSQRHRQSEKVVERFQWISAGVLTVTPLPVVDLLGTAAVNAQMVVELGQVYGCEVNLDQGRELALSLAKTLTSLGLIKGSIQLITTSLQFHMATLAVGKVIQGVSAAYLTRIAGYSFMQYFRRNQDWGDGGMTEVVQQQFQLNRKEEFVKNFIQEAMAKVIKPLTTPSSPPE